MDLGVRGYVLKESAILELTNALRGALATSLKSAI
jgi:DNA-binding NarL/FixJ family response regulator